MQADGGTRCASISGAWVALALAVRSMLDKGQITESPIKGNVAAISAGIYDGTPVVDLDYVEDSHCGTDMNFVMTSDGRFVEIQGTAEGEPFSDTEMHQMTQLAREAIAQIIALQNRLSAEANARCVGRAYEVLAEGTSKRSRDQLFGRTEQNRVVVFDRGTHHPGELVKVRITGSTAATLLGEEI